MKATSSESLALLTQDAQEALTFYISSIDNLQTEFIDKLECVTSQLRVTDKKLKRLNKAMHQIEPEKYQRILKESLRRLKIANLNLSQHLDVWSTEFEQLVDEGGNIEGTLQFCKLNSGQIKD